MRPAHRIRSAPAEVAIRFADLSQTERRAIASGARSLFRVIAGVLCKLPVSRACAALCAHEEPLFAALKHARRSIEREEWSKHSHNDCRQKVAD